MKGKRPYKTIIRFDQVAEQQDGVIKRILGFIQARNLLGLFDDATLDANPRSAKANSVTNDIIESVREDPKAFQFKTRGILLGTSDYTELERRRFELRFSDPAYEGLLDGGHNMLALGTYLLSHVMDEKDIRKLKLWEDMKSAWRTHRVEVGDARSSFDFKVPVELLVPSDLEDDEVVTKFRMALIDVCAARNNNAQLTTEAKANQRGFYDEIRKRMPREISDRVEWKTNEWNSDGRPIKVRDLVALAWIPLTVLGEHDLLPTHTESGSPLNFSVLPQNIYRNKGELAKLFDRLMEHPDVSTPKDGPHHVMHSATIGSAFDLLADLPRLYDYVFINLGDAYNKGTSGKFGRIKAVKIPKRGRVSSPFERIACDYGVPDGFVLPLVYGLKALMGVEDGRVVWNKDPDDFIKEHLETFASAFKMPMEMASFDPQKVAKSENSYRFMVGEVEKALLKMDAAA